MKPKFNAPSYLLYKKPMYERDLILVQHQYNNCTTIPYMRVGPSMWDPPSCEGLLYNCCIDVVNLTFSCMKCMKVPHSKVKSLKSSNIKELYRNTLMKQKFFNLEFFSA